MRPLRSALIALIALLAASAAAGCASINVHSTSTMLFSGQSYRVGENLRSSFSARVLNTGSIPVTIMLDSGGVKRRTVVLQPDSTFETMLDSHERAIISNSSSQRASVKVWTRSKGVRVTYN